MNWIARHRLFAFAIICASWAALVIGSLFASQHFPNINFLSLVQRGEQAFEDLLRREGRKTPTRDDFIFVGIDQQSLQLDNVGPEEIAGNRAFELMTEHPYPWSREIWALLLDRLFSSGARLVIFDMIFNNPNEGDPAFHAALDHYRDRVVIGENVDRRDEMINGRLQKNIQLVFPNSDLIPPPAQDDHRVGFVNFWADEDGRLRAARFFTSDRQLLGERPHAGDPLYTSMEARALQKLGQSANVPRDQNDHPFRFTGNEAYPPLPLWQIFDPGFWHANLKEGTIFKNKAVIVGSAAQIQHDVADTPLNSAAPGPALHLQVMAATMANQFLRQTPESIIPVLVIVAAIAAFTIVAITRQPLLRLVGLGGDSAIYVIAARLLYDHNGFILATVPVLSTFLLGGLSSLGLDYALERREKLRTRRTLERYVSKNLVKEILENPGGYYSSMRGSRKPVSVLFTDLVGFTTLSEKADPEELVPHLNEYLSRMVGVVFENNGTLDKFIGDAVMAVWGNVKSQGVANDAKACARAALGMRHELKKLNEKWEADGLIPFSMGMGINQGDAVIGNIGSYEPHERLDPTVIGDTVNLASRLEALTRTYGVDLLVGANAAELIREEFHLRAVARVQVKGKTEPVDVFTIVNARDGAADQELLTRLEIYEEGIRTFRDRDFSKARILFSRYLGYYPEDFLARMYMDRAAEYERTPPDDDWNAVEVFQKK